MVVITPGIGDRETRQHVADDCCVSTERNLVQRCVIIQKDERGYGLTVSGDRPVYVASVKPGIVVCLTSQQQATVSQRQRQREREREIEREKLRK